MSWTSGLVLFAVIWFMTLYIVLPIGVRSQDEAGDVEPGTPAGAPDEPMLKRKLVWTTIGSLAAFAVVALIIESGIVTTDLMERVFRPDQ